jgi:DNA helicase-2/ATP-dependent DNA helicase PcrA
MDDIVKVAGAVMARARAAGLDAAPVAWMRVRWAHGLLDALFVESGASGGHAGLVWSDWRNAPLTDALLGTARRIEVVTRGERAVGAVLARAFFTHDARGLASIESGARRWERVARGFREIRIAKRRWRPPAPKAKVVLDAEQQRAIELDRDTSLLVLGGAGHGKTTLALHRLARLGRERPRDRMLALVPTEGLRRVVDRALVSLGATVEVLTFARWARLRARRAFPDFPRRRSDTPDEVRVIKRDPALDPALAAIAARPPGRIDDDDDAYEMRSRAHARRADLQQLFGDRDRLAQVTTDARAIERTVLHTRAQFSLRSEGAFRHVDRDRLTAIDGRALDARTPESDAATADDADAVVMFEIDRLRARANGVLPTGIRSYDVIFVDEAQELAPIELRLIARALRDGGSLIVAGDDAQRLDREGSHDWDEVLRTLGRPDAVRTTLPRSHRASPAYARTLARLRAGDDRVPRITVDGELAAARAIARRVDARTMVLVRDEERAVRLARVLGPLGRRVTTIAHARGLEADVVIVADGEAYGDDARSRRTLHFALARARRRALVVTIA